MRDARAYIKLRPREQRTRAQHEIERDLRQRLLRIPGIVPSLGQAAALDNRKPLMVNLRGEDIAALKEYSERLKTALYAVPGVVDLEASLEHDLPEYRVIVDRERAVDVGLNSGAIAGTLGPLVGGQIVTTFEDEAGDARNVRVRIYTLLDDVSAWLRRRRSKVATAAVTAALAVIVVLGAGRPVGAQGLSPASAAAQEQMNPRRITLGEALAIASAQNHDVRKAAEYQNWVRGKYVEERSAALPKVTVTGNILRQFDDTQSRLFRNVPGLGDATAGAASIGEIFGGRQDVRIAEVRFSQPIFTWGQVGAAIRAARVGYTMAEGQMRRAHQAVGKEVATAFYDTLVARELAALAAEDLVHKERHLDHTIRRRALGTATDYDVLAAEVAVKNARPSVVRAENAVRAGRDQLRFLLAETNSDLDVIGTLTTATEPPPPYEQVIARAIRNRPEVGELASQRRIYGELVTIAAAAAKPRVDFASGFGTRSLGLPSIGSTGTTGNASIVATVPIFDGWRTGGRVAQAKTDLARTTLDERKLHDAIALEARVAVNAVREAAEIAGGLRSTVEQAERLVFLAEKGYELGVKTHLEVQDAQLNLLAAKSHLARALRDYHVARVNLDWVTGTLDGGGP